MNNRSDEHSEPPSVRNGWNRPWWLTLLCVLVVYGCGSLFIRRVPVAWQPRGDAFDGSSIPYIENQDSQLVCLLSYRIEIIERARAGVALGDRISIQMSDQRIGRFGDFDPARIGQDLLGQPNLIRSDREAAIVKIRNDFLRQCQNRNSIELAPRFDDVLKRKVVDVEYPGRLLFVVVRIGWNMVAPLLLVMALCCGIGIVWDTVATRRGAIRQGNPCRVCGYDLQGLAQHAVCPECGKGRGAEG